MVRIDSVHAFIGTIVICTTPRVVIMTIGDVVRRGHDSAADVQVFDLGPRSGANWFSNGVTWCGMATWVSAAVAGLLIAKHPPLLKEGQPGV